MRTVTNTPRSQGASDYAAGNRHLGRFPQRAVATGYSGSPLIRYIAPMRGPAVLMEPNHFS